jgi:hypothetical protein
MGIELGALQIKIRELSEQNEQLKNMIDDIGIRNKKLIDEKTNNLSEIIDSKIRNSQQAYLIKAKETIDDEIKVQHAKEREQTYRELKGSSDEIQKVLYQHIEDFLSVLTSDHNQINKTEEMIHIQHASIQELIKTLRIKQIITSEDINRINSMTKKKSIWKPMSPEEYRKLFKIAKKSEEEDK